MTEINIANVGPVESVMIPVPEDGGVVVLRGRNGCGKTTSLNAVESLVRGNGRLGVKDGEARGEVEGFGAVIRVGRSTRRTGELEVTSLEGRLSVADLVDPGLQDQSAADARRIKALVHLSGRKTKISAFESVLGEFYDQIVGPLEVKDLNPVDLAAAIKRSCETAARDAEGRKDREMVRHAGLLDSIKDIDLSAESNEETLRLAYQSAISAEASAVSAVDSAEMWERRREAAKDELADAKDEYDGPNAVLAEDFFSSAVGAAEEARRQLSELKEMAAKLDQKVIQTRLVRDAAVQHEKDIAAWEETLTEDGSEAPTKVQILNLVGARKLAEFAMADGVTIRSAKAKQIQADRARKLAMDLAAEAADLRDRGRNTDEVLADLAALTDSPLSIVGGRLSIETDRGPTLFCELSEGERWRVGLDIGIEAVGEGGLLVIPQEAWEGLDPNNRAMICEHVKGRKVVALTAEAAANEGIAAVVL